MSDLFLKTNTDTDSDFNINSLTIEYINNQQGGMLQESSSSSNSDQIGGNLELTEMFENELNQLGGMYDLAQQQLNQQISQTPPSQPLENHSVKVISSYSEGNIDNVTSATSQIAPEIATEMLSATSEDQVGGGDNSATSIDNSEGSVNNVNVHNLSATSDVLANVTQQMGGNPEEFTYGGIPSESSSSYQVGGGDDEDTSELENNLQELFKEIQQGGSYN